MRTGQERCLIVIADDFGMGPATTAGILQLAERGIVTGSVLLVNSPYAEAAVDAWTRAGRPMDLGWHANLTLDAPVLPACDVPSLIGPDGNFWPLKSFLKRWLLGRLDAAEVEAEWHAQLRRYIEMVGERPVCVNTHQHVGVFAPFGVKLLDVLSRQGCRSYVRRVREPWSLLWAIPGARKKRTVLNHLGRSFARLQEASGFAGNDWLAGITDPPWVQQPEFFRRWLLRLPGAVAELVCHPGHPDPTLVGRDCEAGDGLMQRRVDELALLERPDFLDAVRAAGFELFTPSRWLQRRIAHGHAA